MPSLTLAVSKDLKKRMEEHPELNWSEVARHSIIRQLEKLDFLKELDEFTKDSKLTERDAIMIGRKVKAGQYKRWKEWQAARKDRQKIEDSKSDT